MTSPTTPTTTATTPTTTPAATTADVGALAKRCGFNLQWGFQSTAGPGPQPVDETLLDLIVELGFDFVRLPFDYRFWVQSDPDRPYGRRDDSFVDVLDSYVEACVQRGLCTSLAMHRAPGYCITGWEDEPTDLWSDAPTQDVFTSLWASLGERFAGRHDTLLGFDLVNEPPEPGQRGFTRAAHEAVVRRVHAAIREQDPARLVTIDGLAGGNLAMPELADLDVVQSGRGYQPMAVSHYQASWWPGSTGMPLPTYPCEYDGVWWTKDSLRDFYAPWVALEKAGRPVHIGEFGCYEFTPQDVALAWFSDLLDVFAELGWGYALWQFEGPFGIAGHHRPGAVLEPMHGFDVDRALLDLLLAHRPNPA